MKTHRKKNTKKKIFDKPNPAHPAGGGA